MRILFVCNPLLGHINPLLPLARAAQRAEHEVLVATGADIASVAHHEGVATWSVGTTHEQAGGHQQASWLEYFEAGARARMPDLISRCQAWRPDLIVHEETDIAGPLVAARVGVRSVVHGLGAMPPPRLLPWFTAAIERLSPPGLAKDAIDAWRASTYLHPCPPSLAPDEEPIWSRVLPLRPTTPGHRGDPALMGRIARLPHARSVFVTLGTVYGGNTAALRAAIDAVRGVGANVIVAVGPQGDPSPVPGQW